MEVQHTIRLVQAVQELSLARSMERIMEIVRTVARELTGADGTSFVLKEGDLCYYAEEDAISPLWKGCRFPMDTCISGWAMLNRRTAVIEDIYQDDRIPHDAYRPTFVRSLAMVPIRTIDPIGAIGSYWANKYLPTEEQLTLLQSLADITAVSIENINVYNELETRVAKRTAQLDEAYRELEAFSYSVSHDLRAPLRSIIGYSGVLKEDHQDVLNESGMNSLEIIIKNATMMNLLIDDLLRFSKLMQHGLELTLTDTNQMVSNCIKSQDSGSHKVQFNIGNFPVVYADANLLSQVWTNLISNAIKYSSKKQLPTITISCYQTDDEVVFCVKDNGAGFDMAYADKLFGVFQRLHHNREFEGTGIGLALVKRIISRHGGRVWAEGKKDVGASFYFSLPMHKA